MKKFGLFLATALAVIALPSCNDNEGDYPAYSYFVTVHPLDMLGGSSDYYFTLDDGTTIWPGDKSRIGAYEAKEGQRAVVYFNTLEQKKEGYDYNVAVYHLSDIYTGSASIVTTKEELDAIADDKVSLGGQKLSKQYLTMLLSYPVSDNSKHKFFVIHDQTSDQATDADYVDLQLRHNADGETTGTVADYYVSFDLNELQSLFEGKKGINLRVNTRYNDIQTVKVDFPASK